MVKRGYMLETRNRNPESIDTVMWRELMLMDGGTPGMSLVRSIQRCLFCGGCNDQKSKYKVRMK